MTIKRIARGLNDPVLLRLPEYYQIVRSLRAHGETGPVSSAVLAERMDVDDSLVRKDLARIGVKGTSRTGFDLLAIEQAIHAALAFDQTVRAVIVGAGRLGRAIASYPGFGEYGLHIRALFDSDHALEGNTVGELNILHISRLEKAVADYAIQVGILTVPADAAQATTDRMIDAGIRAIWNFAPARLQVPEDVVVRHEHLTVGLSQLRYRLRQRA